MNQISVSINGREVIVAFDDNSIHIFNAYPIKDDLKLRGYRWNPGDKSWYITPPSVNRELEVLKNGLRPLSPPPTAPEGEAEGDIAGGRFPHSYSVSELRNRIDHLIRSELGGQIWVRGVVASEIKNYPWGSYFDLKDEEERYPMHFSVEVKKSDLEKIHSRLRETGVSDSLEKDLPVFLLVQPGLSLKYTVNVRLTLLDILPEFTQAKIRNQRDITLEQLKAEGILGNQKKLTLPLLVTNIGIITSEQGTSVRDIMAGLHPYEKKYRFFFVDSRMEGGQAVDNVIGALDYLENYSEAALDAVVIARGGGSEQSLSVFNDYRLCRRVCTARFPVLTAIGHEKDLSAVELCSFYTPTPSTPSGLGKYFRDRYLQLSEQLSGAVTRLIHVFSSVRRGEIEKLKALARNIPSRLLTVLTFKERGFISLIRRFEQAVFFTLRDQERRIENRLARVMELNRQRNLGGGKDVRGLVETVFSRFQLMRAREKKQVMRTVLKLDFRKRFRENRDSRVEVQRDLGRLFSLFSRTLTDSENKLENRTNLAQAHAPGKILKRGFALTLDEGDRVVKSLQAFKQMNEARLKFYDGVSKIKREEAK